MPRSREGPQVIVVYAESPGTDEHLEAKLGGSPSVADAIVGYREHLVPEGGFWWNRKWKTGVMLWS